MAQSGRFRRGEQRNKQQQAQNPDSPSSSSIVAVAASPATPQQQSSAAASGSYENAPSSWESTPIMSATQMIFADRAPVYIQHDNNNNNGDDGEPSSSWGGSVVSGMSDDNGGDGENDGSNAASAAAAAVSHHPDDDGVSGVSDYNNNDDDDHDIPAQERILSPEHEESMLWDALRTFRSNPRNDPFSRNLEKSIPPIFEFIADNRQSFGKSTGLDVEADTACDKYLSKVLYTIRKLLDSYSLPSPAAQSPADGNNAEIDNSNGDNTDTDGVEDTCHTPSHNPITENGACNPSRQNLASASDLIFLHYFNRLRQLTDPKTIQAETGLNSWQKLFWNELVMGLASATLAYFTYVQVCNLIATGAILAAPLTAVLVIALTLVSAIASVGLAAAAYSTYSGRLFGMSQSAFNSRMQNLLTPITDIANRNWPSSTGPRR